MRNAFNGRISRPDTIMERLSDLEDIAIEMSLTEM